MRRNAIMTLLWIALFANPWSTSAQSVGTPTLADRIETCVAGYDDRVDATISWLADMVPVEDLERGSYFNIIGKLLKGEDMPWVEARLERLMAEPRGDMFWMYPFITTQYVGRDLLSPAMQAKMRDMWRTYTPYRGDTENHWAMYYTALYLITQMYPDEPGTMWYNGRSSAENHQEAEAYLREWMRLTTTIGQGEYDSPDYLNVYIVPVSQLAAWSDDPEMRLQARMLLELILADHAAETLGGLYAGAQSRIYPRQALEPWWAGSVGHMWILFGHEPMKFRGESILPYLAGYRPDRLMCGIAHDRTEAYTHLERKRTRHRMRHSELKNAPVYKTTFMSPTYAVGSTQGGLLQPIQQKTWTVTWQVDDPQGVHNTLFTVQPHSSTHELGMYFSDQLDLIIEGVTRSKTTYDSPDKWTGGSPYEHVMQHDDAVVALYHVPEDARWPHTSGFFSKDLTRLETDDSGWIFVEGGNAWMAYYPLAPYTWRTDESGDRRLHSTPSKNGAVVEVTDRGEWSTWVDFTESFRSRIPTVDLTAEPRVQYQTRLGAMIDFTYGQTPSVDGVLQPYDQWPSYAGPFIQSQADQRVFMLRYDGFERVLDFDTPRMTTRPTNQ